MACVIRNSTNPDQTTFVSEHEWTQQVGFVVYPRGGVIPRHRHLPLERTIVGTSEVLIVQSGRCEVEVFSNDGDLIATRQLESGDVLCLLAGAHGFRMLEDTVLLEVKQGPYTGTVEKERF